MKRRELRPVCSLGMFDFAKGFLITLVIIGHTFGVFEGYLDGEMGFVSAFLMGTGTIGMFSFFIAAGYGIRKQPAKKCFQLLKKTLLLPYIYTGLLTPVLLATVYYALYHYFPYGATESLHLLSGFALGQFPMAPYFGWLVYSVGPMWFFLATIGGWYLLNFLLNRLQGKWLTAAVCASGAIGYIISFIGKQTLIPIPYCITQALVAVPALYLGYIAKKYKLLEKKLTWWMWLTGAVSAAIILAKIREPFGMATQEYPLGPLSLVAGYVTGYLLLYLFVHINRINIFPINVFEAIGHNTMYILCLHTVEYFSPLWYYVIKRCEGRLKLAFLLILGIRIVFITLLLCLNNLVIRYGGVKEIFGRLKQKFSNTTV